jgi:hypothetical protein
MQRALTLALRAATRLAPHHRRLLAGGAALAGLTTGCSAFRSRFPSHEDVFTPVAVTIGEPRARGADTVYAFAGRGYELVAPTRELLPDAQRVLDDAARTYRRYLAADPRPVVVELRARTSASPASAGGAALTDTPGTDTIVLPAPPAPDGRNAPRAPSYIARPVVRAWLAAYSEANTRPAAPARGDTSAAGGGADQRAPAWILEALTELVAGSPFQEFYPAQLARDPERLIPLRTLFDSLQPPRVPRLTAVDTGAASPPARAAGGGRSPRSGRGAPGLDRAALFAAQSFAVARFLTEREGPEFVGHVAERLLAGARMEDVLRDAQRTPTDLASFERAWRSWLAEQRAPGRG